MFLTSSLEGALSAFALLDRRWKAGACVRLAALLFAAMAYLCGPSARALTNGDVAIMYASADANDYLGFMALTNIPANTTIYFSDLGWTNSDRKYSVSEGKVRWTHTSDVAAGTIVTITNISAGTITVSLGSVAKEGSTDFSGTDSILVSQSNATAGIWHLFGMKWTTTWGAGVGTAYCELPAEISSQQVVFATADNFRFNRAITNGTKDQLLAYITNAANWTVSGSWQDSTSFPMTVNNPATLPTVAFASASSSAKTEGDAAVTVDVRLSTAATGTVQISSVGSAMLGSDFTLSATNFDFTVANSTQTLTITITDDGTFEAAELVSLNLTNAVGATLGATTNFLFTLNDNDTPSIHLDATGMAAVAESAGAAAVQIQISAQADATVQVASVGSATLDSDFTLSATQFVFSSSGATSLTLTITAIDDSAVEASEVVSLNLDAPVGANLVAPTNFAFSLTDNEPAAKFTLASDSVSEGAGSYQVTVYKDASLNTVTGQVELSGSATLGGGNDYMMTATNYVLDGATTSATLTVTLNDDAAIEGSETVILTIKNLAQATTGTPFVLTLTVLDNEPAVQFTVTNANASEGAGTFVATVFKDTTDGNVTGSVTVGGTALLGAGLDYTLSTTNFALNGATTAATITITLNDESLVEDVETVTLTVTNLVGASTGTPRTLTLTLQDNDAATLMTAGDIALIGRVNNASPDTFALLALTNLQQGHVFYFTDNGWSNTQFRNGNTGGGEQLLKLTIEGSVPAGTIIQSTNATSTNWTWTSSGPVPSTANSFADLALATGGDQIYAFQGTTTNPVFGATNHLFVLDDTGAFEDANSTAQGSVPPGLSSNGFTALSFNLASSAFISLNMTNAGALTKTKAEWLAYIAVQANWNSGASGALPAGSLSVSAISVPDIGVRGTNGAAIADGDIAPSLADGTDFGSALTAGDTVDRTFTITNSGGASLTVSNVTLSGAHASNFTVVTNPAGSVAVGGSTTFTLRFDPSADGVRTATVEVASSDGVKNPYDFTVIGTGDSVVAGAITFAVASSSPTETVGSVSVDIQITSQSDATVGVKVAAASSATLTADYSMSATQVVFSASGATQQSITVTLFNDAIFEGNETVVLQLFNFAGAAAGALTNHVLTIGDDDNVLLNYGDVAIIGRINNGTPDTLAIVALTNIAQGQVVYFTDNGWLTAGGFRGASGTDGDGNENLLKLTFTAPAAAGTVIRSGSNGVGYAWTTSGSIPGTSAGSFLDLQMGGTEQIYVFQGPTTNPLFNPSTNLFVLDDTAGFENATSSSSGDIPTGLSSNGNTALSFNLGGSSISLDMQKAGTNSFDKAGWLAFIANVANWTSSSTGALPAGTLNFGLTCDGGIRPIIGPWDHVSVNVGSSLLSSGYASDPTCFAPSFSVTGLPSGASFNTTIYSTSRVGTITWTPTAGQVGVHPVLLTASDGTLTTQRVIRIYVGTNGEPAASGSGIPVSLTNWAVPITNFAEGSSGNATLVWQSVSGIPYDIYATSNTLGVGGTVWEKVGSVTAGAAQAAAVLAAGTTQKFFQVVPAGALPSSNGVWGAVQPVIPPGFSMFSTPLSGDRSFNGAFGAALGDVMTGDAGGEGDRAYYLLPNGSWDYVYLDDAGVWRDSLGGASALVLDPGQGVLFRRTGPTAVQPYFSGPVGNTGASTNTVVEGWNVIGLSEGRGLYIQDAFDATAEGVAYGDYDETVSDMYVFLDSSGYWHRIQRLPDGSWFDLTRYQTATFYLLPGQAGYYSRSVGQGSLKVKF